MGKKRYHYYNVHMLDYNKGGMRKGADNSGCKIKGGGLKHGF